MKISSDAISELADFKEAVVQGTRTGGRISVTLLSAIEARFNLLQVTPGVQGDVEAVANVSCWLGLEGQEKSILPPTPILYAAIIAGASLFGAASAGMHHVATKLHIS